jgi:putative hydrolase of the HAD superfamily
MRHLIDILKRHAHPLAPAPTDAVSQLRPLPQIRAVLFDIYGTLIVSGSGDVGSAQETSRAAYMQQTLSEHGHSCLSHGVADSNRFQAVIRAHHERARAAGNSTPEVEIRDVWREFIRTRAGTLPGQHDSDSESDRLPDSDPLANYEALAADYEGRTNPVWGMPGAVQTLQELGAAGLQLGIVSNAQFYTPLLFPALFDKTLAELGVRADTCFFSYQGLVAKPGAAMYGQARQQLDNLGISADETLYVGNDMLNDIWAAAQIGFRTALFAGDARSLRMRVDDSRADGLNPDLVLTELGQLLSCLAR